MSGRPTIRSRLDCSLVIVLAAATAAPGQVAWPGFLTPWSGTPSFSSSPSGGAVHPAVVRVVVPDRDGATSLGSGALVAVTEQHGLVVTNWHVVRDAAGPIVVAFPDGFRSGATLLKTDRDWDLAALAIWRPQAAPIPLASEPPRPGEPLAIAGYGSGQYRMIAGRCTQYVAPARNQPFEMVELSAPARQGDSGGPILNSRGELAGVLFGTTGGSTMGSYCGRVRWFLTSVIGDFQRLQPSAIMIAQQPAATAAGGRAPVNTPRTPAAPPGPRNTIGSLNWPFGNPKLHIPSCTGPVMSMMAMLDSPSYSLGLRATATRMMTPRKMTCWSTEKPKRISPLLTMPRISDPSTAPKMVPFPP